MKKISLFKYGCCVIILTITLLVISGCSQKPADDQQTSGDQSSEPLVMQTPPEIKKPDSETQKADPPVEPKQDIVIQAAEMADDPDLAEKAEDVAKELEKQSAEKQPAQNEPSAKEEKTETAEQEPKISVEDVIKYRQGWSPVFISYYGKQARDFTVTDIKDKKHTISEMKGKTVMLVFWATWCPPCKMEIPHLKKLREEHSVEKLAIISISSENKYTVADFAKKNGLNYTVSATSYGSLPTPFRSVNALPTVVFLDEKGRIKLAAAGVMSEPQIEAAIKAQL